MAVTNLTTTHNKAFQSDQFMLSCLLLAQKPRQQSLAAEKRRYVPSQRQPLMYVVIFRAEINEFDSEYSAMAGRLRELAIRQYGCKEFVAVTEGNTEVALSYWDSKSQIKEWKQNAEHIVAQGKGKNKWYKSYSVEVTRIEREYKSGT